MGSAARRARDPGGARRPRNDVSAEGPGLWGLSPILDQQIAGVAMASAEAAVFFAVFALYLVRFFAEQDAAIRGRMPRA